MERHSEIGLIRRRGLILILLLSNNSTYKVYSLQQDQLVQMQTTH